jgi:hypothetical protein
MKANKDHPDLFGQKARSELRRKPRHDSQKESEDRAWSKVYTIEDILPLPNWNRPEIATASLNHFWVGAYVGEIRQHIATMKTWVEKYERVGRPSAANVLRSRITEAYETLALVKGKVSEIAHQHTSILSEMIEAHP